MSKSGISHWKILACDLDGTLLGRDHKVNERDLDALRRARTAGIHIAICTGRSAVESAGVIGALNLSGPGVFANGAMVAEMSTGKTIAGRTIDPLLIERVTDYFGERGHAVLALINDPETQLPRYFLTDHGPPHRATTEWLLLNKTHAAVARTIAPAFRNHITRLGVVVDVPHASELIDGLAERFQGEATWHSIYSPYFDCQVIELFATDTTKWTGIQRIAELLGVGSDQAIAIGDDTNDISMLQGASLSFAMGNAAPEIQAHAKRVTARQSESGVAQVIDALLAGQLEPSR